MTRQRTGPIVAVVAFAALGVAAWARESAPPATGSAEAPAFEHADLVRLSPVDEVWIDPKGKTVVVGGRILLDRGPIEVFACPVRTKEHEAIVATKAPARLVHAALLAIGLDPGRPVGFQPEYRAAAGPRVAIRMRWRDAEGREQECPAQDWIRDSRTGEALATDWVFTGSEFWRDPADGREYYQADGGDLICVSNFPSATLDLPVESSASNDALLFEAFEGRVPPRGTPVELILSARR